MNNELIQIINLSLNILVLPLLAMAWSIRVDVARVDARLSAVVEALEKRISRLEK